MTMRLMAGVLLVHGLIHLMGAAKAFGYARLPQQYERMSPWVWHSRSIHVS